MRTKSSTLNIIANLIRMIIQTILLFIVRIVFVKVLGEQYLGLQGLFTNIISMLTISELGIVAAVCYSLYEPLANKNYEKVSQIMTFYKKIYRTLGVLIFIGGLALTPFLKNFVGSYKNGDLNLIYILYIANLSISYFLSYKNILIEADQRNYEISKYNITAIILVNIFQLSILIYTKNFILYLLADFITNAITKVIINIYITKRYPMIDFSYEEKLDKNDLKNIFGNVKHILLFKLGTYLVDGTDNIIISKFIDIATVGIYGNYLSITSVFKNFLNAIISGITSSFGNLIVEEDEKVQENVFNIMHYITFVFFSYVSVCLLNIFNPFITFFYGNSYALDLYLVMLIVLNFYISGMLYPLDSVKSAAGLYKVDKFVALIQAGINLIVSIFLVKQIGLAGVFLGTTFSYIFVTAWNRPYVIYKYIFKTKVNKYYLNYIKEFLLTLLSAVLTCSIINKMNLSPSLINIIITGIVCTLIHGIILILYSFRKSEFKYLLNTLKNKGMIFNEKK